MPPEFPSIGWWMPGAIFHLRFSIGANQDTSLLPTKPGGNGAKSSAAIFACGSNAAAASETIGLNRRRNNRGTLAFPPDSVERVSSHVESAMRTVVLFAVFALLIPSSIQAQEYDLV